jgi:2-polyprenyl-6-methoxyphenol hydroxylase-like FAD-dependent oxidoreductase
MHPCFRLVVGADGANSSVRRLSGISTWGWGYGQEAVVATIRVGDPAPAAPEIFPADDAARASVADPATTTATFTDVTSDAADTATDSAAGQPLGEIPLGTDGATSQSSRGGFVNQTAWQKYLPTGPLAVLPLWDNYASIVWSTSVADARRLRSLPEEAFLRELNVALQTRPHTDKWSVHAPRDATHLPPFLRAWLGDTNKLFAPVGRLLGGSPLGLLERAKQEVAAVADTLMSAAQLRDPLVYPPVVRQVRGPRVSFPLSFSQAAQYTAARCALVGMSMLLYVCRAGCTLAAVDDQLWLASAVLFSFCRRLQYLCSIRSEKRP